MSVSAHRGFSDLFFVFQSFLFSRQELFKFLNGQRTGEIISLGIVTSYVPQTLQLCLCLYALRHRAQIQPLGQIYHKPGFAVSV